MDSVSIVVRKACSLNKCKVGEVSVCKGLSAKEREAEAKKQAKADKLEIKELKKELRFKEKALAETAALLVLRKKLRAFYGEEPGED